MSKRRLWIRRVLISLLILFVVWIGWGFAILFIYGDAGMPSDSYTGSKSLKDRESLEDYVENTVPTIEQFLNGYSAATGAEVEADMEAGTVETCLDGEGKSINYSRVGSSELSLELMLALGQTYLVPNGFTSTNFNWYSELDGKYIIRWINPTDGGYVDAAVLDRNDGKISIIFNYFSSCRSTDGTTEKEMESIWEEWFYSENQQSGDQQSG